MPAVSMSTTGTPSNESSVSMGSRVVPGVGLTSARSSPRRALSSDDLPTLGRPMIASRSAVSTTVNSRPRQSATPYSRSRVRPDWGSTIAFFQPIMRLKRVDLPTLGRPMIATIGRAIGQLDDVGGLNHRIEVLTRLRTAPKPIEAAGLAIHSKPARTLERRSPAPLMPLSTPKAVPSFGSSTSDPDSDPSTEDTTGDSAPTRRARPATANQPWPSAPTTQARPKVT